MNRSFLKFGLYASILSAFLFLIAASLLIVVFGWAIGTVDSGSMEPALCVGEAAICRPVSSAQIEVGDIIAYESPEYPGVIISHRVTGIVDTEGGLSFQTKGDANNSPDAFLVSSDNVKGKIIFHNSPLGHLINFVKIPRNFALLISVPLLILAFIGISKLRHRNSERQSKQPVHQDCVQGVKVNV